MNGGKLILKKSVNWVLL